MAGPITWQNVGQANFGDAAQFMQMSTQNANAAFDSAITRTKENEAKVKAGKTNAIANQIYGITDPETLRAFQTKVDMEDTSIDSNVVRDAFLKQDSILQGKAVDASNMARNEQEIAASKLRGDVDVATLGLNAADQAFKRNLQTEESKRAGVLFDQEKEKNQYELETIRKDEFAKKLAGEAFLVYSNDGDANAVMAESYRATKDLNVLVQTQKYFNDAKTVSESLNPVELEDVKNIQGSYLRKKENLAAAGEAEKKVIAEKYKDVPKEIMQAKAAMDKSGRNTHEAVVTEFIDELAKIDKDAATEFATQAGGKLTSSENEGAVGILKNAADINSPMNTAYQLALGERVEVPIYSPRTGQRVGTSLQLAKGKKESDLSKVSAIQLKIALKALSPAGNFIDDGVNVSLLGKEAAKSKKNITDLEEMDAKIQAIDSSYLKDINDLSAEEAAEIDAMKRAKKNSMSNAVRNESRGQGDRFPINMNDLRNQEPAY